MMTMFVLWLLNGLWLWLSFLVIGAVGRFVFELPTEALPQWYWALSTLIAAAGAAGLSAGVHSGLDRRWPAIPQGGFSCDFALMRDLLKVPAPSFQHPDPSAEVMEPADDHVAVPRIEPDQPRLAPGLLARDQGRARAAERVEDDIRLLLELRIARSTRPDRLHGRAAHSWPTGERRWQTAGAGKVWRRHCRPLLA